MSLKTSLLIALFAAFQTPRLTQQVTGQDLDKILERADKLLEEAKSTYESARDKSSVPGFVDAGFKLEEARIKYIVLQEIGSPEKQKIATDRLRDINQLSKLIHDGKVAITGSPDSSTKPVEGSPAKGSEDPAKPPAADPAGKPPLAAPKGADELTKRVPVPDTAKQREAEKLIKELFKDQYANAKKGPAEHQVLAKALMEQARKTREDLPSLWTLLREAQAEATQANDAALVVEIIDSVARVFDIDAMSMKTAALQAISKTVKAADECGRLVRALQRLIDELVAADQYEAAEKAVTSATAAARRTTDASLVNRMTIRTKEVAEAKTRFQGMKGVLQTLATNPDDPAANSEMGQFLCFVKGSWELGPRFLVKGSDPVLKALCERELTGVLKGAELSALGDSWYDLVEKEKSPLRKAQMLVHARTLYESALPGAEGLLRSKLEKRLGELATDRPSSSNLAKGQIDLLKMIDLKRDSVSGTWKTGEEGLVSPGAVLHARVQIPYIPPEEYDVVVTVRKNGGNGAFGLGLVGGGYQFVANIDAFNGEFAGLSVLDGKASNANETSKKVRTFTDGQPRTLSYKVRREGVTVLCDEKPLLSWKGDYKRFSVFSGSVVPNKEALFIDTSSDYTTSSIVLTPIRGQGRSTEGK